jgi:hypothetical protein
LPRLIFFERAAERAAAASRGAQLYIMWSLRKLGRERSYLKTA